jgi:hypothetical protein
MVKVRFFFRNSCSRDISAVASTFPSVLNMDYDEKQRTRSYDEENQT